MDEFAKDIARVKKIANSMVAIFNSGKPDKDKKAESLWREYRSLRTKYTGEQSNKIFATFRAIWK